jgi:flagellar FliL protein
MLKIIRHLLLLVISLTALPIWAEDEGVAQKKAIYYAIADPFTINFLSQSSQEARFLQIKVSLMAHDQYIINQAKLNLPMLQDELHTLFSEQTLETVNSVKGRKELQLSALKTVKTILKEETGKDNIDAVYFTSFILQ